MDPGPEHLEYEHGLGGRRKDIAERARRYQTHRRPDKRENVDLDIMMLDTINLEEVGKDEGLYTYEKVSEDCVLAHSANITHSF